MIALEVDGVHTFYGQSHVLHGVSLRARAASATAILGRNGAGKTTLIRTIMGLTPARSGRVLFQGREIQRLPTHLIARMGIGLVPQGRRIFRSLTVAENLRLAAVATGSCGEPRFTIDSVYELFPRLRERHRHYGDQLSGGEQQMLAIGRALMTNPRFLLMDEPSEGLAPVIVQSLAQTIGRLRDMGLGILLVEQNLSLALACAEDAYILSKGEVVWAGSIRTVAQDERLRHQHLAV